MNLINNINNNIISWKGAFLQKQKILPYRPGYFSRSRTFINVINYMLCLSEFDLVPLSFSLSSLCTTAIRILSIFWRRSASIIRQKMSLPVGTLICLGSSGTMTYLFAPSSICVLQFWIMSVCSVKPRYS